MSLEAEAETEHTEFDMLSRINELMAEDAESEVDPASEETAEVGPESEPDTGELAEDDGQGADDVQDEEEDPQEQGDDESEFDSEGSDEDEDSDAEEVGAPDEEATDPREAENARLRALLEESHQRQIQFLNILTQLQAAQQAPQPKEPEPLLPEEVARLALSGKLDDLPPEQKAKAAQFIKEWEDQTVRHAIHPDALFKEKVQPYVEREIQRLVGPLLQEQRRREADTILDRHLNGLDEPSVSRVSELFLSLGGDKLPDTASKEKALKMAVDFVKKEAETKNVAERERKVETRERQRKANREAAKRKGGRRGSSRPPKKQRRPWSPDSGVSLADYARGLAEQSE